MKKIHIYTSIMILALAMASPTQGAIKKIAQTGLQFLKQDMSARATAMGGAYTVIGDDATSMFNNPAGIARVRDGIDAFATQVGWIADINYMAAGVVLGLGNMGSIGLNAISVDYGYSMGTVVDYDPAGLGYVDTDELDWGAMSVGGVYARQLTDRFTVGTQIRYSTQRLGESILTLGDPADSATTTVKNKVGGVAYEIGTVFYPGYWNSFRFGMSIKNFSQTFTYEEEAFQLPLTFSMGAAVDLFEVLGMDGNNTLLFAIDALHPRDYTERLHMGAEFGFMDMAFIRAGYKFNYDVESLSLGGGVKLSMAGIVLRADVAYSMIEYFDNVMKFTVGLSL